MAAMPQDPGSTTEFELSAGDGCRLWSAVSGHGPVVVLCHGGPGLWDTFADVAALLSGHARVVRFDQRGCGRSQRIGPFTFARSVADLDDLRKHLGVRKVVLVGHSWGAALALRYMLEHPEHAAGMVYVSGTGIDGDAPWKASYEDNLRRRLGADLQRWLELKPRPRTASEDEELAILQCSADFTDNATACEQATRMLTPFFGVNYDCNKSLTADSARYWASTDVHDLARQHEVPVLIVDGRHDIRPRWAVDSLHQALPNARRVTLAAGHLPWVEDPHGFHHAVTGFLASLVAQESETD